MNNNDLKFKKLSIQDIEKKLFEINNNQISNRNNIIYKNNLYQIKNIDKEKSIDLEIDLIKMRNKEDNIEKFNLINFKINMIREIQKYQDRLKYLKEIQLKGNPPFKYLDEDIEKIQFKINPYK